MAAAVICLFAVMWGIPIAATAIGIAGERILWVVAPLQILWFVYFAAKSVMIRCPRCGRSVFMRGLFLSVPWPAKRCGKCERDLTVS
jgi:hypothetical protein